jgi:hypothetical protein
VIRRVWAWMGLNFLGYSPLVAGLIAIPQGVGGLLRGMFGPRLLERWGLRWFLAGTGCSQR